MRVLRTVLFVGCCLLYLILCPLTILHALGYSLHPGSEQGLVKTGLISLATDPPGASIYVGNKRYTKRTPTILSNLLPGDYPITVVLKRHRSWSQTVHVEEEKAIVLEHILLLPEVLRPREVLSDVFDELAPLPGTHLFLLSTGPRLGDLLVYNWKEGKDRPLLEPGTPLWDAQILTPTIEPGSSCVLLQVQARDGERYVWIDLKKDPARVEDITTLVLETPERVGWDPLDRRHLFTFQHGVLNHLNLSTRMVQPKWLDHVRGFGIVEKTIYAFTESATMLRLDYEGRPREAFLNETVFGRSVVGKKGRTPGHFFPEDPVLFLGVDGALFANQPPYQLLEQGVLGFAWDTNHEHALLWLKGAIGIIRFHVKRLGSEEEETQPSLQWIFTKGKNIQHAFWAYDNSHVVFQDADEVFLLSLESSGPSRVHRLLPVKRNSLCVYADEDGVLYYLDRATHHLAALQILPKSGLLFLPASDRTPETWETQRMPR